MGDKHAPCGHLVDLHDSNVPVYCHQLVTMGSNVTDFVMTLHHVNRLPGVNLYYNQVTKAVQQT